MKFVGILLIAFGAADLVGSYTGYDLWNDYIGVTLPNIIWKFSPYIEMAVGFGIMMLGAKGDEAQTEAGS